MRIPGPVQALIGVELRKLAQIPAYTIPPGCRAEICAALGPSCLTQRDADSTADGNRGLPVLSFSDRIRAYLELITAKNAAVLWRQACQETDAIFGEVRDPDREPPAQNALYAIAGLFDGEDLDSRTYRFDESKRHEFWIWWLSTAIPQAVIEAAKQPRPNS
jgi:hypothetical protein